MTSSRLFSCLIGFGNNGQNNTISHKLPSSVNMRYFLINLLFCFPHIVAVLWPSSWELKINLWRWRWRYWKFLLSFWEALHGNTLNKKKPYAYSNQNPWNWYKNKILLQTHNRPVNLPYDFKFKIAIISYQVLFPLKHFMNSSLTFFLNTLILHVKEQILYYTQ